MKVPSVIALTAVAALILTGCSGADNRSEAGCVVFPSGPEIEGAKITGELGSIPTIDIATGTTVDSSQSTVVVKGSGEKSYPGDTVVADLSIFDVTTGAAAYTGGYDGTDPIQVDKDQMPAGLVAAVGCQTVGSRVAVLATAADMYGDAGHEGLGVGGGDTLLIVADVRAVERATAAPTAAAEPEPEAPDRELSGAFEGLPDVLFGDGVPTVELPTTEPAADLQVRVLEEGAGSEVAVSDTVSADYLGINWRTGVSFDNSYDRGTPLEFSPAGGMIEGFAQAVIGQKVGSKIIVSIPSELGYGVQGSPRAGIRDGDTLVFVIEILESTPGS